MASRKKNVSKTLNYANDSLNYTTEFGGTNTDPVYTIIRQDSNGRLLNLINAHSAADALDMVASLAINAGEDDAQEISKNFRLILAENEAIAIVNEMDDCVSPSAAVQLNDGTVITLLGTVPGNILTAP